VEHPVVGRTSVVWWPEALHHVAAQPEALKDFAYVVLEELVDEEVVLMSWSWPHADREGHLYWRAGKVHDPSTAVIGRSQLRHQLYPGHIPDRTDQVPELVPGHAIAFQEPQEIQMLELRQ